MSETPWFLYGPPYNFSIFTLLVHLASTTPLLPYPSRLSHPASCAGGAGPGTPSGRESGRAGPPATPPVAAAAAAAEPGEGGRTLDLLRGGSRRGPLALALPLALTRPGPQAEYERQYEGLTLLTQHLQGVAPELWGTVL